MHSMDLVPQWYAVLCGVIFGLLAGSFLNVVIWRVPRAESIVRPPSACPGCGAAIRGRDNIPVLSWMLLRGRCRDCSTAISRRYPLIEASTGLLFGVVVWHFGVTWAALAYLYLTAIGVALTMIDLDTRRLPNVIVLPAYPITLVLLAVASWSTGEWGALLRAGLGGVILYGFYFVMMVAVPNGMGFGDVKLAGVLGAYLAWLGWGELAIGAFAAPVLGGVYAMVLLATKRAHRKSGIPFGPWMVLGATVGIAAGAQLWRSYLGVLS